MSQTPPDPHWRARAEEMIVRLTLALNTPSLGSPAEAALVVRRLGRELLEANRFGEQDELAKEALNLSRELLSLEWD